MERVKIARELRQLADELDPPSPGAAEPAGEVALARFLLRANRRVREHFDASLFADPARDILLDLFVSGLSSRRVSVTSCSAAAGVPHTTGLRWVQLLRRTGYVLLRDDPRDRRRSWVELTPVGLTAMRDYLDEIRTGFAAGEASDAPPPGDAAPDRYAAPPTSRRPRRRGG